MIGNNLLLAGTDEGYNLTRSLRFRSSASASLSRTPASAGNRKTWTWSAWVKRGSLSSNQVLFISKPSATSDATFTIIGFSSSNTLLVSGYSVQWRNTTQVFRDPSAWYHIVVTWDTTQATAANRVKVYVNGSQVTAFGTTFDPSLNFDGAINQADAHYFCYPDGYSYSYFDGYLTEVNFVDGQGLTPSSFGETDTITGVWKPKRYAGTYGTNGFYLPFTDNSALTTSSNAGLGKDFSGNGNYYVTNNISITAGVTYDSMTDVPTLTSATAANFAVLNPLQYVSYSITNGNLTASVSGAASAGVGSTIAVSSGKWYFEVTPTAMAASDTMAIGVRNIAGDANAGGAWNGGVSGSYIYRSDGYKRNNGTSSAGYGASYTTNDVVGVALDLDAGTLVFYKNNTSQGTAYSGLSGTFQFSISTDQSSGTTTAAANFGQRPFTYTPPTGYVALNTYNLPDSTVLQGNKVMDATLYTGNSSTQTVTNAGGFKPDLVWYKDRSVARDHGLFDSVRGVTNYLSSNLTNAEQTVSGVTAFNSNGFTLGGSINSNNSGETYVGWQWQAGQGTTSSNTNGTITSTVSVNASAGFSVVTYTGNGTNPSTVGHGLGVAPSMVIVKNRNSALYDWNSYHISLGNTQYIALNTTAAASSAVSLWNNTTPTSSVFTVNHAAVNTSANTLVAYCWTPIAGYSAFGSYTGNGSNDGPFVYVGFRPKFVMIKRTDSTGLWYINDSSRDTYNVVGLDLSPNSSAAESNDSPVQDFLSNGFKLRNGSYPSFNANGGTYIYAAFAESPFKNSLAR